MLERVFFIDVCTLNVYDHSISNYSFDSMSDLNRFLDDLSTDFKVSVSILGNLTTVKEVSSDE